MNKRMILYIQGAILLIEAAIMVLPIAAALIYREPSGIWFFYTALAAAIIGFAAMKLAKPRSKTIYAKEGDSDLSRRGVRNDLGLYNDRFEHPAECGGAQPLHAALAELFPLAGRHGHSGVHAGNCQNGGRAGHPSAACGEPRTHGRQDGAADGRLVEDSLFHISCPDARAADLLSCRRHAAF